MDFTDKDKNNILKKIRFRNDHLFWSATLFFSSFPSEIFILLTMSLNWSACPEEKFERSLFRKHHHHHHHHFFELMTWEKRVHLWIYLIPSVIVGLSLASFIWMNKTNTLVVLFVFLDFFCLIVTNKNIKSCVKCQSDPLAPMPANKFSAIVSLHKSTN